MCKNYINCKFFFSKEVKIDRMNGNELELIIKNQLLKTSLTKNLKKFSENKNIYEFNK